MRTISYSGTSNRGENHRSPDVWYTEPFDEELELWTLADKFGFGFTWVLMPAHSESKRCREVPKAEGIAAIREEWEAEQDAVVLAGTMIGSSFDIEIANLTSSLSNDHQPVDLSEAFDVITRVCERMRALQLYDGSKIFDADDTTCLPFTSVVGIGLKALKTGEPPSGA
jgi:hypothetical protein